VHVATPDLSRAQLWLTEGLATYVEPIARARAGELSAEKVWADMLDGMPKGLQHEQGRGLDGTRDWGRIYWGGALYCLLADVEIHERTGNRQGLEDALRAVLIAGGTIEETWPLARFLDEADRPLPAPVLRPLYERLGPRSMTIDLAALWKKLGVAPRPGGGVVFDDSAPLAAVRRAITARAK
jgi:predicted metalloprotease with PDZ domain